MPVSTAKRASDQACTALHRLYQVSTSLHEAVHKLRTPHRLEGKRASDQAKHSGATPHRLRTARIRGCYRCSLPPLKGGGKGPHRYLPCPCRLHSKGCTC